MPVIVISPAASNGNPIRHSRCNRPVIEPRRTTKMVVLVSTISEHRAKSSTDCCLQRGHVRIRKSAHHRLQIKSLKFGNASLKLSDALPLLLDGMKGSFGPALGRAASHCELISPELGKPDRGVSLASDTLRRRVDDLARDGMVSF